MGVVPAVFPQWFPQTGMDGTSGSELWLQVMSLVQGGLGSAYLFRRRVLPWIVRELTLPEMEAAPGAIMPFVSAARSESTPPVLAVGEAARAA